MNTYGLKTSFRALRYRNYRLFFGGQAISLIGTWMQRVAMSWLVYRLTNSAFLLGMVGFVGLIPTFLLVPIAGVLADRWSRHRIMVVTQTLAMIQAFTLALLAIAGLITVWHIIALSIFLGVVNAFDTPVRQSFVVEMVEGKEDLGNAIALNSSIFNVAQLVGPSVAGVLVAVVGEGMCFLLNALSFIAVIGALLAMKVPHREADPEKKNVLQGLKEGFTYAYESIPIRTILLMLSLISLVGMSYTTLMPIFAKDILRGGPDTLGFLMASTGVGALIGAAYLASRKGTIGLGRQIPLAIVVLGVSVIAFSLSRNLWLSLVLVLFAGLGRIVQTASSNTVLQTIVDEDKRGRVMSFYAMSFMGMAPFGNLIAGSLASTIGAPNTVLLCGLACLVGALLFARRLPSLRAAVRPIYARMEAVT